MRTRRLVFALAAALVLMLGACGNDSSPGLPEVDTVPPNPPVGLQVDDNAGGVRISWTENAETDLAGYRVYRSSNEEGPFRRISSGLVLCPWYYDTPTAMAMTYYRVTAVDESGNESAFSDIIGVYYNTGRSTGGAERPMGR